MPPLTPPTTSAAAEGVAKPPVSPAAPHSSTLVKEAVDDAVPAAHFTQVLSVHDALPAGRVFGALAPFALR